MSPCLRTRESPATGHKHASRVTEGLDEEILSHRPRSILGRNLYPRLPILTGGPFSPHGTSGHLAPSGDAGSFDGPVRSSLQACIGWWRGKHFLKISWAPPESC